jgi:hypothetical protein
MIQKYYLLEFTFIGILLHIKNTFLKVKKVNIL